MPRLGVDSSPAVLIRPIARACRRSHATRRCRCPTARTRVVGSTDATRGCKHLCRHCPIVPVYKGRFPRRSGRRRAGGHPRAGRRRARSTSRFGDPDFFNGPTHARRIVDGCAADVSRPHLRRHDQDRASAAARRDAAAAGATPAACSSPAPSNRSTTRCSACCAKGHTRADFVAAVRAVPRRRASRCRRRSSRSRRGRRSRATASCCETHRELELVEHVAPFSSPSACWSPQVRRCSSCPTSATRSSPFDPASLTWPWRHPDPGGRAAAAGHATRRHIGARRAVTIFDAIHDLSAGTACAAAAPYAPRTCTAATGSVHDRSVVLLRGAVAPRTCGWCEAGSPRRDDDRLSDPIVRRSGRVSSVSGSCSRATAAISSRIPGGTRRFRSGSTTRRPRCAAIVAGVRPIAS